MRILLKKAQSLSEYALVLSLVFVAVIAIQLYVKRGLQARFKDASDTAISSAQQANPDKKVFFQYEPYYNEYTTNVDALKMAQTSRSDGEFRKDYDIDSKVSTGTYKVGVDYDE
ncbi:MAG: hypothetical protein AB1472_00505 [Candidatus Omnitrophota bacterium]